MTASPAAVTSAAADRALGQLLLSLGAARTATPAQVSSLSYLLADAQLPGTAKLAEVADRAADRTAGPTLDARSVQELIKAVDKACSHNECSQAAETSAARLSDRPLVPAAPVAGHAGRPADAGHPARTEPAPPEQQVDKAEKADQKKAERRAEKQAKERDKQDKGKGGGHKDK